MTTLTTDVTSGIVLTFGSYTDPVVVNAGVTISSGGNTFAINGALAPWTIQNYGLITTPTDPGNTGIRLDLGGAVTNCIGGEINGSNIGVDFNSGDAILNNYNLIAGGSAGVSVSGSGTVTNQGGAVITGGQYGVHFGENAGTIVNSGTIAALDSSAGAYGIKLGGGGTIVNGAAGVITGYGGVRADGTLSILNFGTIVGVQEFGAVNANAEATIQNFLGGTITGYSGIYSAGDSLTVANIGAIIGTAAYSISVSSSAVINNFAGGVISGYYGIHTGGAITLTNAGTISSSNNSGVETQGGGIITNAAGGVISGYDYGIESYGPLTLTNSGSILQTATGGYYYAINALDGLILNNTASGIISGYYGIYAEGETTITNAGTIIGQGQPAIIFAGTSAGRLIIDPGAVFSGAVQGSSQALDVLELASGASAGVLDGLGTSFTSFLGGVHVDSGARWTLSGAGTSNSGVTIDGGTLTSNVVLNAEVYLTNAGGVFNNTASGTVTGASYGVYCDGPATVTNAGTINGVVGIPGTGVGVGIESGYVHNQSNGTISGRYEGVHLDQANASLVNDGMIVGTYGVGAYAGHGDTVTNTTSGVISGSNGVDLGSGGSLFNAGSVIATGLYGVTGTGMTVVNAAGAQIFGNTYGIGGYSAGVGPNFVGNGISPNIVLGTNTTIENAGTISGSSGTAVLFSGFGTSLLIIDPNAVFGGIVAGSATGTSNLELASGAATGTLTGLGVDFTNIQYVTVDAGAQWTLTGNNSMEQGRSLSDYGTVANVGNFVGGVNVYANADITNDATASITGGYTGIDFFYGTTFTNDGLISASYAGVVLREGGSFTNSVTGTIAATGEVGPSYTYASGVKVTTGGSGDISNAGVIISAETGIYLASGGIVSNASTGLISSYLDGVFIFGAQSEGSNTIDNAGTIVSTGSSTYGAVVVGYGTITNQASGLISGASGVGAFYATNTVINYGLIQSSGSGSYYGVEIDYGQITNGAGASILAAGYGIFVNDYATILNAGTISGGNGFAVVANTTYETSSMVIFDPGAVFIGDVVLSATVSNTLELASAASAGSLSGLGVQFQNFDVVNIDAGAQWVLGGTNSLGATSLLTNDGTLILQDATFVDAGGFANNGQVLLDPSTLEVASLSGTGSTTIEDGSTLHVDGAVSSGEVVIFATGGAGELILGGAEETVAGTVANFAAGDVIDVQQLAFAPSTMVASVSSDVLTITNGDRTFSYATSGLPDGSILATLDDGNGGTDVVFGLAAPTGLTLTAASDSGTVGDNITNVALPTLTGTAAPLSVVRIYDGTSLVGMGSANQAGVFTIVLTTPLGSGLNSLTATVTGMNGSVSAPSAALPITLLGGVPSTPTLSLAPGSDTGTVGDNITSVAFPTLTGTATPLGVVRIYDGENLVGTGTANQQGIFSITLTVPLTSGLNDLYCRVTSGNNVLSPPSVTLPITLTEGSNPPAPVLTLSPASDSGTVGDHITNVALPTLTGATVGYGVVRIYDGAFLVGTGTADGSGAFAITLTTPLANGLNDLTCTVTNSSNATSARSPVLAITLDAHASPPAPTALALATASDTALHGDGITSIHTPVLTGLAVAGSTVTVTAGSGTSAIILGVAVADGTGHWSLTPNHPLADGLYEVHATATGTSGASSPSQPFALTIDSTAPALTAAVIDNPQNANGSGIVYGQVLGGAGDPFGHVVVKENGVVVGTATADAQGNWSFDPSQLTPGPHALATTETDAAGNITTVASVPVTVLDPRFDVTNITQITSGTLYGSDYHGPVSYLSAEYSYTGSDNVVLGARVADVYLHSGSGDDAEQAIAGSNVLDGSTGSNWLVGATGTDGGTDTFFVDGAGQTTWDTLLNFHAGDMLTLWGYDASTGSLSWSDNQGSTGYQGATLHADFGGSVGGTALITFNGLSTTDAHFAISTGNIDGQSYMAITHT